MHASAMHSSSWRDHVQDQEDDLVRELMQADDVDAVLARMEGDHFRHLSPVIRKLNAFDAPLQQQQQPPSIASAAEAAARGGQRQPPPPPPPLLSADNAEASESRPTSAGRRLSGTVDSRDERPPAVAAGPYAAHSFFRGPPSAASSTYRPTRHDSSHYGAGDGDFSPAARPPPPPPPPPPSDGFSESYPPHAHRDPLEDYRRRPLTSPTARRAELETHEPSDAAAESRYHATMDSWLRSDRIPPMDVTGSSTALRTNPFTATRPPTQAAVETSALTLDGMLRPPSPGSPWTSSGGRYHGHHSSRGGGGGGQDESATRSPRLTTTTTTMRASASPPQPRSSARRSDLGELENVAQSRIARQLQLLRNYRDLAELCSSTRDPSVDLFRGLPSEELARMQADQLQHLPQREGSPITVNNNYYFEGHSGHSPRRSGGRHRVGSGDTTGRAGATVHAGGNSRSVSELLTLDSHHGLASHQLSGASSVQPHRPPLLPSPRAMALQSPQLSSGPDSPLATPPLSRGSGGATSLPPVSPPAAGGPPFPSPPTPSRSYRARSHRSRLYDAHNTPTATTEEAGSSYDDNSAEGDDYAGDFLDNDEGEEEEGEYDDATAPRPPPPRIIEREQHRRFPNANGNGDYSTGGAQPQPNSAPSPQLMQQQQQQQQQPPMPSFTYSSDYVTSPSGAPLGVFPHGANAPSGHSRTNTNKMNFNGSEGGRRSVSSAINVLSGEQELRVNAQHGNSGMVESRRGSRSPTPAAAPDQQSSQSKRAAGFNGNASMPLPVFSDRQPRSRRSLSAGSIPAHQRRSRDGQSNAGGRGGEAAAAHSDPGIHSLPLSDTRRDGRQASNGTPEKWVIVADTGSGGHRHSHTRRGNGRQAESGRARRQGRGRSDRRSEVGSDYVDNDLDGSSLQNDASVTDGDTPGNPQLQTHNPRSSALRKRHHGSPRGGSPSQKNAPGRRDRRRYGSSSSSDDADVGHDGDDGDGAVHTPRNQKAAASSRRRGERRGSHREATQQPRSGTSRRRPQEQQQSAHGRRRRDGDRGGRSGSRAPSAPYYNEDGVELNSASTYSYSYTTSSDVSNYMAGSYYSPIKSPMRGRGRGAGGNAARGGRSPMRGRGGQARAPAANAPLHLSPQQLGAVHGGRGSAIRNTASLNSPPRSRGRGIGATAAAAAAAVGAGGRGRGRAPGSAVHNNMQQQAAYAHAAGMQGRGRGGPGAAGSGPHSSNRLAAAGAMGDGQLQSGHSFGGAPTHLPLNRRNLAAAAAAAAAAGSGLRSPLRNRTPLQQQQQRMGGGVDATGLPGAPQPGGVVYMPDGRAVSINSPAGQQLRQLQLQQQQQQQMAMHMGLNPRGAPTPEMLAARMQQPFIPPFGYPGALPALNQQTLQQPLLAAANATSPTRHQHRAASPPLTPSRVGAASSAVMGGGAPRRRTSSPGAGVVHIHPGLLYGSLLPKARAKTALVVEDDEQGRERSVGPFGNATHEPFMDRGSVCPVQPSVVNVLPLRNAAASSHLDTFPVSSPVNGATVDGVQPLAWKSGGSGFVASRSGHLPPAPSTKLSSHYRSPTNQQQQQSQGGGGGASSAGNTNFTAGVATQQVVSIMQAARQQPQQQSAMALRPAGAVAQRRDSAFSLQSDAATPRTAQQHYRPQQELLETPAAANGGGGGGLSHLVRGNVVQNYPASTARSSVVVIDPYAAGGRTAAATRSANVQRFGITQLQD